jgi:hypothetical protein
MNEHLRIFIQIESEENVMKQDGNLLSGRTILGLCLVVIGLLTLGYGGVEFGFGLSLGFQSFLIGGLLCILVGLLVMPSVAVAVKLVVLALTTISILLYIHSMPDLAFLLQLISDVAVIGFAAFWAVLLLRK